MADRNRRRPEVDPLDNLLGHGDRVQIPPTLRDPRAGQLATVRKVRLESGDLMATVRFDDGAEDVFYVDELTRVAK